MARAQSIDVAGTVQYRGSHGPVSSARPIVIALYDNDALLRSAVAHTTVSSNPAPFTLAVSAAGTYYPLVWLDTTVDGVPDLGEPFTMYGGHFTLPAEPLIVPDNGVTGFAVTFDDTALVPGIAGTVTYSGHLGTVSSSARLLVEAFTDASLTGKSVFLSDHTRVNGAGFQILTWDTRTYYLLAAFDVNGDLKREAGEPYEIFARRGQPPADPVIAGPSQTAIDFSFGDGFTGAINTLAPTPSPTRTTTPSRTPTPTHTPTPTRTPTWTLTPTPGPCVGDCDHNGRVTVDELVRGVAIALGPDALVSCETFDADHDGRVSVEEIVLAVNAELHGCLP